MRASLTAACLALTLAACGANTPQAALPAPDCNKVQTAHIDFTGPNAQDVVETRAIGARCASAFVMITVRKATGEPLWAYATPHPWLALGAGEGGANGTGAANGAADDEAAMDAFLENWRPKVDTTAALPDWPERERVFTEQLGAFERTPFDRDAYLEVRAKALPRLCYATGIESGECIYYDAATGAASKVWESGA